MTLIMTMTGAMIKIITNTKRKFNCDDMAASQCDVEPAAIPFKLEAVPLLPAGQLRSDVLGHFLLVRRSTRPAKCPCYHILTRWAEILK